jgi:hypothetical protein
MEKEEKDPALQETKDGAPPTRRGRIRKGEKANRSRDPSAQAWRTRRHPKPSRRGEGRPPAKFHPCRHACELGGQWYLTKMTIKCGFAAFSGEPSRVNFTSTTYFLLASPMNCPMILNTCLSVNIP